MDYTVREFEEAVMGAQIRYVHQMDLLMRHALVTGQWTQRVTFHDLTGREQPLSLDPRVSKPQEEQEADELIVADEPENKAMRAWMQLAEARIRASAIRVEGDPQQ